MICSLTAEIRIRYAGEKKQNLDALSSEINSERLCVIHSIQDRMIKIESSCR